jgi:hypothetical protein
MSRSPLTAVPAQRSSLPLLRIRRRIVLVLLILAALAGVGALVAWAIAPTPEILIPVTTDLTAESLARVATLDYLAARDSAVPAASDVDTQYGAATANGGNPQPMTVLDLSFVKSSTYTLGDTVGAMETIQQETFSADLAKGLYTVNVAMLKTSGGWVLAAQPSLSPAQLSGPVDSAGIDYSSLYTKEQSGKVADLPDSDAVTRQIDTWATAYAQDGGNSVGLYTVTGDQNPNHHYTGLNGWSVDTPTIDDFVAAPNAGGGQSLIVRVSLVLHPGGANGPTLNADYDVLVELASPSQGNPPVTAWGPAGSYHTLTDYQNAH